MGIELQPLPNARIPRQDDKKIILNGQPLSIADPESIIEGEDTSDLTAAIGVATILYNWCPDALYALLDLESWFSFTWILTTAAGDAEETKYEIGRIKYVLTMGILDKEEHWKVMVSYTISPGEGRAWIPNTEESMLDDKDVTDPGEIDRLGQDFVKDLILKKAWQTGKKSRHDFFIETAPMDDAFSDGIAMNPHWLYRPLDLTRCTTSGEEKGTSLSRCSKCGTAAYCSSACQRADWAVHKAVCNMSMEDRGKALHLTKDAGLVKWCRSRDAQEGALKGE